MITLRQFTFQNDDKTRNGEWGKTEENGKIKNGNKTELEP